MKTLSILLIGIFFPFLILAQAAEWKLKKEQDDLRVYTRKTENSGIQEIKVNFTVDASLTSITALLNDVAAMPQWIYACAETRVLKRLSPTEMIYYGRVEFPLTMNDRDYVLQSKLRQDPKTKVVHLTSNNIGGYVAPIEKRVRVPKLLNKWRIQPLSAERVQIEYQLATDPGGSIPSWLINLAIDKGPLQSIKGLKEMVQQPKYRDAKLAYIKDLPKTNGAATGGKL
jgi:ribosome-associated toxin RatA of RatAB toxin-antitoxin module